MGDALGGDMHNFQAEFFDGCRIQRKVSRLMDENRLLKPNLLLIQRFELKTGFRGLGIGAKVVDLVIQTVGVSCSVIATQPLPLQYAGWKNGDLSARRGKPGFEADRTLAWGKVEKFRSHLGFAQVPGSGYYVYKH